jgi:DNA replication and repair protein RecF
VLHGPNGAGKTSLLEAVSLLSPGRGLRRAAPEDLARAPGALGWKLSAGLAGPDGTPREVVTLAEPGGARQLFIDAKPAPQLALARLLTVLWLVPAMDRLWLEGAADRRRFLDRATMSFVPDHAEAALAYDKAMRERNRLLKDGIEDRGWHDALEHRMAVSGAAIIANRLDAIARLNTAQQAVASAFPRAALSLVSGDDWPPEQTEGSLRTILRDTRRRDMAAQRTLSGPHRNDLDAVYADKDMPAAQCSTGEQKALLVSLILGNARALAAMQGRPPVLLLDEVAAHLDDARRAALYDEILALGGQAFLTGTGADQFAALAGRAQALAVADDGAGSRLVPADATA